MARGGSDRRAHGSLFRALRTDLALLDRTDAAARGGLVFGRGNQDAAGCAICPWLRGGRVFFWGVFSWLHTVTVPGLILVGLTWVFISRSGAGCAGAPQAAIARCHAPCEDEKPLALMAGRRLDHSTAASALALAQLAVHNLWLALHSRRRLDRRWNGCASWMFSGWGWNGLGVALHASCRLSRSRKSPAWPGFLSWSPLPMSSASRRHGGSSSKRSVRTRRPHYDFTLTMAAIVGLCGYGIRLLQVPVGDRTAPGCGGAGKCSRAKKNSVAPFRQKTFDQFDRADPARPRHASRRRIDHLAGKLDARRRS